MKENYNDIFLHFFGISFDHGVLAVKKDSSIKVAK